MNIGVVGAGSWGTALADLLARNGHQVTLWAYEADLVARMRQTHENDLFLPGIRLHDKLGFTDSLAVVAQGRELLLLVSPSQLMRLVFRKLLPDLDDGTVLVSAAKGIENQTLMTMSQVLEEELEHAGRKADLAFLSGPSFAREVALGLPTAVVAASEKEAVAELVQQVFSGERFRVYTNDDVIGIEFGGALKNVMALAAGIADGLGFGANTRAALITRGLSEMTRLGVAAGACPQTFAGLAGMGDLVLTCTGDLSRNRTVGLELGRGRSLQDILGGMNMVAEGVKTTISTYQLAARLQVEAPITEQVYKILEEGKDPRQAVTDLLQRSLKAEVQ
ncbi:MAG: NAD(P)-dependent glycerol-3-phosphate dehydrogenase [Deltaproteobacteria bacterium]|nr:NAD(P)-dependent glycerol-3-phosphate dehydrogenase [Deltaproteobacteria bacterium]